MQADTSYLTDEERKVVNLLIQAADLMNPIYLRQVSADNPRIREEIAQERRQGARSTASTPSWGRGTRSTRTSPSTATRTRPVGAGFYPAGLTKEQFDDYLAKHPDEAKALTDPYTVVKRAGRQARRGAVQPGI